MSFHNYGRPIVSGHENPESDAKEPPPQVISAWDERFNNGMKIFTIIVHCVAKLITLENLQSRRIMS